ncbi:phenylacetate--CoA ligase family protein [Candidatus Margulisiibacteriota bacterium]
MIRKGLRKLKHLKNYQTDVLYSKYSAELSAFEQKSYTEKKQIQQEKLRSILAYAKEHTAYYANILKDQKIASIDISAVPILDKDIIKSQNQELLSDQKVLAVKDTSGGTTGEPIIVWHDKDFQQRARAYSELYYRLAAGRTAPSRKLLKLWGSERDVLRGSQGLVNIFKNYINNTIVLNSFKMAEPIMDRYISKLNDYKPDIIEAYASSMVELTRFIETHNKSIHQPSGIIVSAGTLYEFMEKSIRAVFPTAVLINRYGSRETGNMAFSCNGRKDLHITMLSHYLEVVDDQGRVLPDGTEGNLLVTSLANTAMPVIRYAIGDRATMSRNTRCPHCGWEGDILEEVVGRTVDVFKTRSGNTIPAEYFIHMIGVVNNKKKNWIKKFQLIQQSLDNLELNIVLSPGYSAVPAEEQKGIALAISKVLPEATIKWNLVDDISHDKSGKVRFIISKVK